MWFRYCVLIVFVLYIEFCMYVCMPVPVAARSKTARLLRSWVRFPPGTWMFVYCECCVLSGRDLCDELITCPEESYRRWCVVVCDLETSWMGRPWPALGRSAIKKTISYLLHTKWGCLASLKPFPFRSLGSLECTCTLSRGLSYTDTKKANRIDESDPIHFR